MRKGLYEKRKRNSGRNHCGDFGASDEEYRAKLGFKEGEEKQAKFTLMASCTKEVIKLHQKLCTLDETIKIIKGDEKNG